MITFLVNHHISSVLGRCIIVIGFLIAPVSLHADDNNTSGSTFADQKIKVVVPFKEGGGTDLSARFNTPYISKHLPGVPQLEVTNMPGGASTKAANIFSSEGADDGLSLLYASTSTQFAYLLGDPRVRYDYDDWHVLMISQSGGVVYISPELGVKSVNELSQISKKTLYYGSQGTTSFDLVPLLAFHLLGLNVRPIFGISGRAVGRFAFERGDATIDFQTSSAYLKSVQPLVDQGRAIPLFSLGVMSPDGEILRDPNFPDLPHLGEVIEVVTGKPPAGDAWESWVTLFTAGLAMHDVLVAPKNTKPNIVEAYHDAVSDMLEDPAYLEEKDRKVGDYMVLTGEPAEKLYKLATTLDRRHKNWLSAWLKKMYNVNLKN